MSLLSGSRLHELGVCSIAQKVATGELKPTDLVEALLSRITNFEDRVQAWSYLDREDVQAQATVLTAEAAAGKLRGPLHGVPVGIKDEFHVQGIPTGMRNLESPVPEPTDATPVARLRAAGAIIMGKTHMPVDGVMPPTRNPWNLDHTAGGTSSGSGAAVAARMVPVTLGEQSAGSNLRPAAYCGVDALKPTYGRISRFGCYPFAWSLDHVGIIGLNIEDMALVLSVIAGPDPLDPTTLQDSPPPAKLNMEEFTAPRIGVVRNFFPERAEPAMLESIERSATRLKEAGAELQDVVLPRDFALTWPVHRLIMGSEGATFNAFRSALGGQAVTRAGMRDQRPASLIPATYYLQAQRIRGWLRTQMLSSFWDVDALLMPAASGPAPKGLESTGDAFFLVPWSLLGYPSISINGGLSLEGLPLGLQFVASPKEDFRLLHVGAWCENVLGRLPVPPLV